MNKRLMILDLICYGAIPFLIWNYGREPLGDDYIAILLSTVPGFVYTVYRFIKEKQLNILGLTIITSLLLSTIINLLSTSAINMLWNQVYLGFAEGIVFLLSTVIKKPLALYFAVDLAYLQGHPRKYSRALYKAKGLFIWFQLLNLLFTLRYVATNSLKAFLVQSYGAEGYGKVIIYMNICSWIFNGLLFLGFIIVSNKIAQYINQSENKTQDFPVSTDV
ncbi:VC0807 family protein [Virgibacillus sp. LDC-1]|uniref:VC0807 family protein n=1 Tax=Virgibacillus sp. LDC-1 TaxID=3039856 RepID=UPI0024DE6C28|nr:VC0807 family protein [Virgibacillus sp. LDC-1]